MIKGAVLAAAALTSELRFPRAFAESADSVPSSDALIDTHAYLSQWPFRRVHGDETSILATELKQRGVTSAWVSSFDALLHLDIGGVNARLAQECMASREVAFMAFGAVNPTLPDWEEDLRRCHEEYRMPGLRLHPDFHGYTLNDPRFERLLDLATQRKLIVQIALGMEVPPLKPRLEILPPVSPAPLLDLLPKRDIAQVVLLNYWRSFGADLALRKRLCSLPQVSFDTASIESAHEMKALLTATPDLRLLFGSGAPQREMRSALDNLEKSGGLRAQLTAIKHSRAEVLLHRT